MNTIILVRHGATAGNLERRYIGRTDEPLCTDGVAQVEALAAQLPVCDDIFVSPMIRCVQTARILFPAREIVAISALREMDFGIFEGKSAQDMLDDAAYAAWLDTACTGAIPEGEAPADFKLRVCTAFAASAESLAAGATAAYVIHGGCIMAILEWFALPARSFYDAHIGNAQQMTCRWDGTHLTITGGALC